MLELAFKKNNDTFDLMDLSSGERIYALNVLALAFSVTNHSIVLFDEPENSLHPKWQSKIMKDMWALISKVSVDSKLIVATHSPLIVSGAANDHTHVLNMGGNNTWAHSSLYGNSVDVVLKQQFELTSPRAMSFVVAVRDCVEALVTAETEPAAFKAAAKILFDMEVRLDRDDPLYATVEDIREEWERVQ